jgi:ATP-dependent Clp protease ATP-binding subunit ClpX
METPKEIKDFLDQYVIGQDAAKRALAVAAYNHIKRTVHDKQIKKSNVLMIGPTGSGKSYLVGTLAKALNIQFITIDATQLTASGYAGRSVEDIFSELVVFCKNNLREATKAIIHIDEIDKIKRTNSTDGQTIDVGGLGVQQSLLKVLEGTEIVYDSSVPTNIKKIDTTDILFICSGAFVGLESSTTEALTKFGMIPEFLGRFSVVATLNPLSAQDLKTVLMDSKGSILKSFIEWFDSENIELVVQQDALDLIIANALKKNLGARGLQNVLDEIFLNAQFESPNLNPKPKKLIVDAEVINTSIPKWEY